MQLKHILLTSLMALGSFAYAQPGNLGQLELTVTEKYKARVGEAIKISDFPDFKDTTTKKLPVTYSIESQPIPINYNPKPLKPARIAKIPAEKLRKGMVRLGVGLYGTPLLEAYYNYGRSSKYAFGIWAKHLSTQTGVDGIVYDNNNMSNNEIGAYATRFYNKVVWKTEGYSSFDKYSYYGKDVVPGFNDTQNWGNPPEIWRRQFGLRSSVSGKSGAAMGMLNKVGIDYYHFQDDHNSTENSFDAITNWSIPAGDKEIALDANMMFFRTDYDSLSGLGQSNFTLQFRPNIEVVLNEILFEFGFNVYNNANFNSIAGEVESELYFFPEIQLKYSFVEDVLTAFAGAKGELQQNTYRSLSRENPFIDPNAFLIPTARTDFYLGMEGILSSSTSFSIRGGIQNVRDQYLYFRAPNYLIDSVNPGIGVLYDDLSLTYARGELQMNVNNNINLNVFAQVNGYSTENQEQAWHLPVFVGGLDFDYLWKRKIGLGLDLTYTGPREAFPGSAPNDVVSNSLSGFLNADLNIQYIYNSRLSAFVNAYNLFNSDYDWYLGYRAQNVNVMMGITYQF